MDDILAKKNRHLFLEEKDNQNNSFIGNINDVANRKTELDTVAAHIENVDTVGDHIDNVDTVANNISDINDAVDNIATVKTFNDNVNNGTMQYLLEAFTTSLNEQGNAWEVRLTQLGESILATTSAFNYSTVVTVSSDIPANGTLILPNSMKYKVGTHMLMVSWNGTVCYAGEQYDEVGAYGVWATSIKLNQPAKAGDKIQLRIVALTDQSSYVDITEAAINASQFVASGSNTERYLPEFLGDVVNVKNFGAVGNGVNDDTTAFQSAIASGKAVFVPEGTYKLNTDLTGVFCGVGDNTFIGGTVNGSTILRGIAKRNNDIINVKDFGAKGDGETDDTEAVQTAVETGRDVFFPAGTYLISESISCTQSGQRFYGESGVPTGVEASMHEQFGLSSVVHSTVEAGSPLFSITAPQVEFCSIGLYADENSDEDNTICFNALASSNTDDIDFYLVDCTIFNFTTGAKVYGRCLTALRNLFANCSHSIVIDWPSSGTVISVEAQGPILGHRALRIQNNRFHHVTKAIEILDTSEDATLKLRSGDISHNTLDVGGVLVYTEGVIDALKIQGNICDLGNSSYIQITGNAYNTLIDGNIFHGDPYDGADSDTAGSGVAPYSGVLVTGSTINGMSIVNNSFSNIDGYAVTFQNEDSNLDNINFSCNNCNGIGQDDVNTRAIFRTEASIDGFVCVGNSGDCSDAQNLVRGKSTSLTQISNAYISNNSIKYASNYCLASLTIASGVSHPINGDLSLSSGSLNLADGRVVSSFNNVIGLQMTRPGTASTGIQIKNNNGSITLLGTPSGTDQGAFNPLSDNKINLGTGSYRFGTIYAGTGSINTSDEKEKTDVVDVSEGLMRAWGKINFKLFKFLDAVAKKGESARLHVGIIAQQIQIAFASEGLDASRYGLFCYDEWEAEEAEFDENGNVIVPAKEAGNRYGIRYEEALALECAYQRWLGEQRDVKIEALMQRISALENNH